MTLFEAKLSQKSALTYPDDSEYLLELSKPSYGSIQFADEELTLENLEARRSHSLSILGALWEITSQSPILVISHFIESFGGFATATFIANLGEKELKATALIAPLQMLLFTPQFFFESVTPLVGELRSSKQEILASGTRLDHDQQERILQIDQKILGIYLQAVTAGLITSLVLTGVAMNSKQILELCGQNEKLAELTQEFFTGSWPGLPFYYLLSINQSYIISRPTRTSSLLASAVVALSILVQQSISVALGYGFTSGQWGLPQLGIKGIGYGNSVGSATGAIGLSALIILLESPTVLHTLQRSMRVSCSHLPLAVFGLIKNIAQGIGSILKLGVPIFIYNLASSINLFMMSVLIGVQASKDPMLLAYNIMIQYSFLFVTPMQALSAASAALAAKYSGNHHFRDARKVGVVSAVLALTGLAMTTTLSASCAYWLIRIFVSQDTPAYDEIAKNVKWLFIINGIAQMADSMETVFNGSLQGLKRTYVTAALRVLSTGVQIGLYFLAVRHWENDISMSVFALLGVHAAVTCLNSLLTSGYWLKCINQEIKTNSEQFKLEEKSPLALSFFNVDNQEKIEKAPLLTEGEKETLQNKKYIFGSCVIS